MPRVPMRLDVFMHQIEETDEANTLLVKEMLLVPHVNTFAIPMRLLYFYRSMKTRKMKCFNLFLQKKTPKKSWSPGLGGGAA